MILLYRVLFCFVLCLLEKKQIVKWFWEVMGGFETEQLARVLQFVTGTSGVPSQGFAVLQVRGRSLEKGSRT